MVQTQKVVEQLGYTPNEAKVYIATLQLGECHISDIAHKLKMPPSSVQIIIDKLHKNGLVNFYTKKRYKYWVAENPERLLTQLQQREAMVREAMPALSRLRKKTHEGDKPSVKIFTGRDEIKYIFDDIIDTKHHILAIIPQDAFLELFEGTSILEEFIESRAQHFLRIRMLAPNTPTAKQLLDAASKELRDVRLLPERIAVETATFIYGDKVAFIMFNQKQPTGILIEDPGMRETKSAIFEEVWSRSGALDEPPALQEMGLFRVIADSSPQALLIADDKGAIIYVNRAWEEQFGYSLAEVEGQHLRLLKSGKTPPDVYERMWRTLHEDKPFQSDEIIDRRKDGSVFNLLTTIFPVHGSGQLWYVQILDDITQRKRVEELQKDVIRSVSEGAPAPIAAMLQKLLDGSASP